MNSMRICRKSNLFIKCAMIIPMLLGLTLRASHPATSQASTQPSRGVILLGTVYAADGSSPIPDAKVWICVSAKGETKQLVASTRTNRVGAFCINQYISQGNYEILILEKNGDVVASQPLAITKDNKPVTVLSLVAYKGVLEGTVFDAAGKPAGGIVVVFTDDHHVFSAKTDKDGHYIVNHIADGTFDVLPQVELQDKDGMLRALSSVKIDGDHVTKDVRLERD
jgi:hypothetical protein